MKMYLDMEIIRKNAELDYNENSKKSVQNKLALIFGYRSCGKTKAIIDYLNSVSDNEVLLR